MPGKVWRKVSFPVGQKRARQKIAVFVKVLWVTVRKGNSASKTYSTPKGFPKFNVLKSIYKLYLIYRLTFCNFELMP